MAYCFLERPDEPVTAVYEAAEAGALEAELGELTAGVSEGRFEPTAQPHRGLCADCPGRPALCSWDEERTLAERGRTRIVWAAMTLGARMTRLDEAAFVGRRPEIGFLDALFVDDPPANVVLVHGPGGIGKSSLLRRMVQRGQEAGWTPLMIEGRDLPPVADALDDAVARAHSFKRPLVVLDTYERMQALGGHLRREVLPDLPDETIVVIAGRGVPDPAWREGGWENLTVELELTPLDPGEARALLTARGVDDPERAAELAEWAGGSPLALTLAAQAAVADPEWSPAQEGEPPEMVQAPDAPAGRGGDGPPPPRRDRRRVDRAGGHAGAAGRRAARAGRRRRPGLAGRPLVRRAAG